MLAIYEKCPQEKDFTKIAKQIADKFLAADQLLQGNYNHSYFDYGKIRPASSWICPQPDVAAGHSWVLYSAYKKFGERKYLEGATSALKALAANMAARLNAEQGEKFDLGKMLEWTFNGDATCRKGWGVLVGRWNGFDVSGLVGSTTDRGGYGFVMNTYDMAWPLVPLVRYDQTYAAAIGKWMLHAANATRLAYPQYAEPEHQTLAHLAHLTKGVIAYEGIAKWVTDAVFAKTPQAPIAQGDGPRWIKGNPAATQFSVYGSAHVGIFGSIIRPTNEAGILQLNLLATDFFHDPAYPTYLYYNPHADGREVTIPLRPGQAFAVYDTVSGTFLARGASSAVSIKIAPLSAVVIVLASAAGKVSYEGKRMLINGVVVNYLFIKKSWWTKKQVSTPDSAAVRVPLWRALHVQVDNIQAMYLP